MDDTIYFSERATWRTQKGEPLTAPFRPVNRRLSDETVRFCHLFVKLRFWDWTRDSFASPILMLWDTGADVSIVGERFARDLGIELPGEPEELLGIGAGARAWSVRHPVRLPYRGFESLWFPFCFYVMEGAGPAFPLLGLRDVRVNFDITSRGDDFYFVLRNPGHEGLPIVDGQPDPCAIR